ncbi:aminomethyl-transferring glycine dehydrogenase subunit GcvPA [Sorangium sp. So ce542]|uniref:aminomethyl-transferring glycine dehydrogenase subunit GcvPA n=1 Tax=Sorangium sp. So ce542 TaxID=3133316 RepID=UPI003F5E0D92
MESHPEPLICGYNVHREADRQAMLEVLGLTSVAELFSPIPQEVRLGRELRLPPPHSEWALGRHLRDLASRNASTRSHLSFLGGGVYEHHIPAVVDSLTSSERLMTAYTPYQPEMSQGLLQILFEYQRMLSLLTGLGIVNSSLYDGATAMAEAAWMACAATGRRRVLASSRIWPEWKSVLELYMRGRGVEVAYVAMDPVSGRLDLRSLHESFIRPAATFILQTPNSLGILEDLPAAAALCRQHDALLNVSCYPMTLALLKPPGELGADIVTCEGQPLGLPLSAGGPSLGVLACAERLREFMPGRLVGEVRDIHGQPALALIMEWREQQVSREKATSNICSNQAHQAMRAAIYLAALGERGFRELAAQCAAKARYLHEKLLAIPGVEPAAAGPFFNEFALRLPCPVPVFLERMLDRRVFAGLEMDGNLLVAVTEVRARAELDEAAALFAETIGALRQ